MASAPAPEQAALDTPMRSALAACRPALVGVAVFSGVTNILSLTGSLYMLQVYDRVLPSKSVATLIGLSIIAVSAYLLQGALESIRMRMLARIGASFDSHLSPRVYETLSFFPIYGVRSGVTTQGLRDLDQVRNFLSGLGPTALIDMPWMPLFVAFCFLLHPLIGLLTLAGGLVIIGLALLTEVRSRQPAKAATASGAARHTIVEATLRNAEVLRSMGMNRTFGQRFAVTNKRHVDDGLAAADVAGTVGSAAKIFRAILQSAVLALGAYLAINHEMSPGGMVAASILTARALAPVEMAVAHWKGFVSARQSYERLSRTLAVLGPTEDRLALPRPRDRLTVTELAVAAPGQPRVILQNVSFQLNAGQGLGIIGPSASGKSTLARALIGVWSPARGHVRLDGASLDQWDPNALSRHIGYLPQDIELFDGTIAENIARFEPDATPEAVIKAAQDAGAHEMILALPGGYETPVGAAGIALSGGQRQRVALARALYSEPFLVVLDEPNSNLDTAGEDALVRAIQAIRGWGGIAIIVTHRATALAGVDQVALMADGQIRVMGRRDEVLQAILRQNGAPTLKAAAVG
ncbi:type I secretion system permease/ATPase [Salinarimonas soli]|uniref:Type I secretion system permease/ATPase n=1 Tax=Salinarimonas soli TaxID=1638099 RepID=A0A5B2VV84_9HYPH|nr:type I secretion system permease/ATPase [Salinarimonas soli]KAA2242157.1 type I secretion system permease/ATPase [Salinarimonas soli]